jgi:hypothetical protein
MPVRHARSETRDRPPCARRGGIGKNGSTRSLIWKQHRGHNPFTLSHPRDQVSEVLLHALRCFSKFHIKSLVRRYFSPPSRRWPRIITILGLQAFEEKLPKEARVIFHSERNSNCEL